MRDFGYQYIVDRKELLENYVKIFVILLFF